jgi:aminodeoxyfutalosine deaminase
LAEWFRFRDFGHFVEVYSTICDCLRTADDFELVAYELAEELARQNARYAEVAFSPAIHARAGVDTGVFLAGLGRARERARRELGFELAWVVDVSRAMRGGEAETMRWADYAVGVAVDARTEGVVALGLGGPEIGHPPEPFAPFFERARAAGLHAVPHAGETAGPASVWGALRALGAERIGHGVRATEDPALLEHLAERRIALEVNPTSNIRLGVYPRLADHPLRRLHDAGCVITVNSDDPALFGTTLSDEVALLAEPFGLEVDACDRILLNAVRHSFLPDERRVSVEGVFRRELDALRASHVPD